MKGEISYDLVMCEDMAFVEGSFRVGGGDWQVFIFTKDVVTPVEEPKARLCTWFSGVTGVHFRVPIDVSLNKRFVEDTMSKETAVDEWTEVRGPDSIHLR
jgi:hypothetical protein